MEQIRIALDLYWLPEGKSANPYDPEEPLFTPTISLDGWVEAASTPGRGEPMTLSSRTGATKEAIVYIPNEGTGFMVLVIECREKEVYRALIAEMIRDYGFYPDYLAEEEWFW